MKKNHLKLISIICLFSILIMACATKPAEDEKELVTETTEEATEEVIEETETEAGVVQEPVEESSQTNVNTEPSKTEPENNTPAPEEQVTTSWVADLNIAQSANQIIVVSASGSSATVSMHNKNADGTWTEILSTPASIGRNGIGKTSEGDGKTPVGVYSFMFGFGIKSNPGTAMSYTQVDDSYYWVDDVNSAYYNQFVSTNNVTQDWTSAEHLLSAGSSYHYALAINYNEACTPGVGSAIFMHCKPTGGAGCIAVSESSMVSILKSVQPGCVLIIDSASNVWNY